MDCISVFPSLYSPSPHPPALAARRTATTYSDQLPDAGRVGRDDQELQRVRANGGREWFNAQTHLRCPRTFTLPPRLVCWHRLQLTAFVMMCITPTHTPKKSLPLPTGFEYSSILDQLWRSVLPLSPHSSTALAPYPPSFSLFPYHHSTETKQLITLY